MLDSIIFYLGNIYISKCVTITTELT